MDSNETVSCLEKEIAYLDGLALSAVPSNLIPTDGYPTYLFLFEGLRGADKQWLTALVELSRLRSERDALAAKVRTLEAVVEATTSMPAHVWAYPEMDTLRAALDKLEKLK